mgnify:CR=1 FL=1
MAPYPDGEGPVFRCTREGEFGPCTWTGYPVESVWGALTLRGSCGGATRFEYQRGRANYANLLHAHVGARRYDSGLGVSLASVYELKRPDSDYFDPPE